MVAHHIHYAHLRYGHLEELGAQVDSGTYKKTAVAATVDGDMFG